MNNLYLLTFCLALFSKLAYSLSIVKRCGDQFVVDNKSFYFIGSNSYYLHCFNTTYTTPEVLDIYSKFNFTVMRTWGFHDIGNIREGVYYTSFNNVTREIEINEGENGLQRLDYIIAEAEKRGIRIILPLTNNWEQFGGIEQWVAYYGFKEHHRFYTEPELKKAFKKYIKAIVNRTNTITGKKYKEDGTIFAWEIANEPRCWATNPDDMLSCNKDMITNWLDEMSTYIRKLDKKHMIATGEEGYGLKGYNDELKVNQFIEGSDFLKNAGLKNIDFVTVHLYPSNWEFTDYLGEGLDYIISRIESAKSKLNKPVIMEEFGLPKEYREEMYPIYMKTMINYDYNGIMFWMVANKVYGDHGGYTLFEDDLEVLMSEYPPIMKAKSGKRINKKQCKKLNSKKL
ncbi:glycoside hydrolase [Anaeromyces robustus]|uniref:mannan endo-1,4-beta-mannosidase n=1 Tax=Anaeromyces robustus TaxID=1754192 RepID=A0A1Y1VSV3_9FUNG|nr:glycoside hydrolase [Anaeromyces robustus]|eukprot:ORX64357.1 glycoside hydrolase [Anaeromyces robustus]